MTEFKEYVPRPIPCREHVELLRNRTAVVGLSPERPGVVELPSARYGGQVVVEVIESLEVRVSHKLPDTTSMFTASPVSGLSYRKTANDGRVLEQWAKPYDEQLVNEETTYVDYPLLLMVDMELSQYED